MIIEINNSKTKLIPSQVDWVKNRLRFSLSRFNGSVSKVLVRFDDVNGPKGGVDKCCLITVKLRVAGDVVVKGDGRDYFSAIGNCAGRLQRTINRTLERRRQTPIRLNRRRTAPEEEIT
jgi:putative sigma-54 modulation protein